MSLFRPNSRQRREARRKPLFWRQVFEAHDLDPATLEARTRIAWRITRFLAILQGRILPEAPLSALEDTQADDLQNEADIPRMLSSEALAQAPKRMLEILEDRRIPLVPPRPNPLLSHEENAQLEDIYQDFHAAVRGLKKYLPSAVGYSDPFVDSREWYGILDLHRCFQLYPDISEILLYEEDLIAQVLKMQTRTGFLTSTKYLREHLMLSKEETRTIEALARKQARQALEMDQEDERAIMTLRLQDHQRRSRLASNLREELQGLKQEAIVRGLTKSQPETFMDVFARVVDQTDKQQGQLQPAPISPRQEQTSDDEDSSDE